MILSMEQIASKNDIYLQGLSRALVSSVLFILAITYDLAGSQYVLLTSVYRISNFHSVF